MSTYLIGRLGPAVINLLALAVFTSLVVPEDYGRFALIVAWQAIVNVLLVHHFNYSLPRFWNSSNDPLYRPRLVTTVVSATLIVLAILPIILVVVSLLYPALVSLADILALTALCASNALRNIGQEVLRASFRVGLHATNRFLGALVALSVGYVSLRFEFLSPHLVLVYALVAGDLVVVCVLIALALRVARPAGFRFEMLTALLKFGLPINVTTLANQLALNGLKLIVEFYLGPAALGVYAVTVDLSQRLVTVLMQVPSLALIPHVYRYIEDRHLLKAREVAGQLFLYSIILGAPVVVFTAAYPREIVRPILGPEFRDAAVLYLAWFAFGTFVVRIKSNFLDLPLLVEKRGGIFLLQAVAALLATLLGAIILLPVMGLAGAAIAYIAAFLSQAALALACSWKSPLFTIPVKNLIRVAVAIALSAGLTGFLKIVSPVLGPETVLTSLGVVGIFGAMTLAGYFVLNVDGLRTELVARLQSVGRGRSAPR